MLFVVLFVYFPIFQQYNKYDQKTDFSLWLKMLVPWTMNEKKEFCCHVSVLFLYPPFTPTTHPTPVVYSGPNAGLTQV